MQQQSLSAPAQQGITLSGYIKNWLKGMFFAFKPKNLPFTLGITVLSAVVGTLLTVFVFPGLFSLNPTVNAAYGGLAVSLTVTTIMNIVIGFLQKKGGYFSEIASVGKLWFEMFGKKNKPEGTDLRHRTIGVRAGAGVFFQPSVHAPAGCFPVVFRDRGRAGTGADAHSGFAEQL